MCIISMMCAVFSIDSESHSYPAVPRPPLSTGHLNTTSEYKTKYVEFPLQEREVL